MGFGLFLDPSLRPGAAGRGGDDQIESLHGARLFEKIVSAEAERAHRVRDGAVTREEEPFAAEIFRANFFQQIQAVSVG